MAFLVVMAGTWYYIWTFGDRSSGRWRLDLALVGFGVLASAAALFRQHRTTEERRITTISRDPDNTPITPRW